MVRSLYIFEVSELHHDCLQSLLELALEARAIDKNGTFDRIVVVTLPSSFQKLSPNLKEKAQQEGVSFKILAKGLIPPQTKGILNTIAFQERLKRAIWHEVRHGMKFRSGDVALFVTAEMFISPVAYRIATFLRSSGAAVVPEVHNVFIYFQYVIKPEEVKSIRRFYLSGYEVVVERFGKLGEYGVLLRKKYLNSFTQRLGKLANGFILPSVHIEFPKIDRPILKILTSFPKKELLERRKELIGQLVSSQTVTFTIPGQVSEKRRDYDEVIDAVGKLSAKNFQLILLGRLTSSHLAQRIEGLPSEIRSKIQIYRDFIDEPHYRETILRSHYILMPIIFPYGRFKTTGGIGDAIQMGVPMVLPQGAVSQKAIPHISYRRGELADTLAKLIDLQDYDKLSLKALSFSERFLIDRMALKFIDFIKKLVARDRK